MTLWLCCCDNLPFVKPKHQTLVHGQRTGQRFFCSCFFLLGCVMQEISPADPSVRTSSLPSVIPAGSVVFIMLLPPLCSLVWRTRWSDSRKLWSISQLPPNPAHLTWGPPLSSVSSKRLRTQVQKTGLLLCNLFGLLDVLLFTVNKTHLSICF